MNILVVEHNMWDIGPLRLFRAPAAPVSDGINADKRFVYSTIPIFTA